MIVATTKESCPQVKSPKTSSESTTCYAKKQPLLKLKQQSQQAHAVQANQQSLATL